MYTRFNSSRDFLQAVEADTRTRAQLIADEPELAWAFFEYRLWKTDNPHQLPFEEDFRRKLTAMARSYQPRRRPKRVLVVGRGERLRPSDGNKHVFELFGIEWRAPEHIVEEAAQAVSSE